MASPSCHDFCVGRFLFDAVTHPRRAFKLVFAYRFPAEGEKKRKTTERTTRETKKRGIKKQHQLFAMHSKLCHD